MAVTTTTSTDASKVVFSNSTAAANENITGALTEDSSDLSTTFSIAKILGDSGGGGKTTFYSLDNGTALDNNPSVATNNGFSSYDTDLLYKDVASADGWHVGGDTSAKGAHVWFDTNNMIHYDANGIPAIAAEIAGLGQGESFTDTIKYTIRLSNGTLSVGTLTVKIDGVNDKPVITSVPQSGTVSEGDDGSSQSTSGQVTYSDADVHDTHSFDIQSSASHGTATVDDDGTWHYTVSDSGAVDALSAGDHLSDSFTVRVSDNHGGYADQIVNIDIVGTNDDPVITSDAQSGDVSEGDGGESQTANGQVTYDDVDAHDTHTFGVQSPAAHGTAGVDDDGNWTYTVIDSGAVDALAEGEHLADSFTVRVSDNHGGYADQVVDIDIVGTNDDPVITAHENGTVSEGDDDNAARTTTGTVTYSDADTSDTHTLSVSQAATYGTATVDDDGTWHYTVSDSGAVDALAAGEHLTDHFTVNVADNHGGFGEQVIDVTITGTNDAPVIVGGDSQSFSIQENTTAVGQLTSSDVDGGTPQWSILDGGEGSLFTIDSSGNLAFLSAPDYEHPLDSAPTNSYHLTVQVADGHGGTDTQAITVTVTNDTSDDVVIATLPPTNTGTGDPNDFDNHAGANPAGTTIDGDNANVNETIYGGAGNDTIHGNNGDDTIYGGSGNDVITGDNSTDTIYGGSGNDTITGGNANDQVYGGYGADTINADSGSDTIHYLSVLDTNDTINGFTSGFDKIDLSAIDADTATVANDAFLFGGQVSGAVVQAHSVTWSTDGTNTQIYADTDGDLTTAEFHITLSGVTTLSQSDFNTL